MTMTLKCSLSLISPIQRGQFYHQNYAKNNTGHRGPASHPGGSSNALSGFMQRKL